jgi:ammonia channel protein AmtB
MAKLMWMVTVIMSLVGAVIGFTGISAANGAPQEAAAAAMGLACAVIPYCAARALSELRSKS